MSLTDTLGRVPVHVIPCLATRIDNSNLLTAASACRLQPYAEFSMSAARRPVR